MDSNAVTKYVEDNAEVLKASDYNRLLTLAKTLVADRTKACRDLGNRLYDNQQCWKYVLACALQSGFNPRQWDKHLVSEVSLSDGFAIESRNGVHNLRTPFGIYGMTSLSGFGSATYGQPSSQWGSTVLPLHSIGGLELPEFKTFTQNRVVREAMSNMGKIEQRAVLTQAWNGILKCLS